MTISIQLVRLLIIFAHEYENNFIDFLENQPEISEIDELLYIADLKKQLQSIQYQIKSASETDEEVSFKESNRSSVYRPLNLSWVNVFFSLS